MKKTVILFAVIILLISIFGLEACEDEIKPDQHEEFLGIYECTFWQTTHTAQGTFTLSSYHRDDF